MPSYLALLHTNRGYQRFKMIELALTTYSVLFVDNQSLLCKWRFHNCTAYAIFILMIQSVYWIIDQYQSVMQSYFLRNAFPCSLTAFFLLKYFPKSNLCGQALYLWNGLCFGLVYAGMSLSSIQYLVTANIWSRSMSAPWDVSTLSLSLVHLRTWLVLTKGCLFKWFRMWGTLPAPTHVQNPNLIDYSLMILVHLMPPFVLKVNCNLECINKVIRSSFDSLVISCDQFTHPSEQFLLTIGSTRNDQAFKLDNTS